MENSEVTKLPPRQAPGEVTLNKADVQAPRFTPRELDLVEEAYGKPFSGVLGDETSDRKLVALAWLKLRRDGWGDLLLEDMADTVITLAAGVEMAEDPTGGPLPTTSPHSVGIGE